MNSYISNSIKNFAINLTNKLSLGFICFIAFDKDSAKIEI